MYCVASVEVQISAAGRSTAELAAGLIAVQSAGLIATSKGLQVVFGLSTRRDGKDHISCYRTPPQRTWTAQEITVNQRGAHGLRGGVPNDDGGNACIRGDAHRLLPSREPRDEV